MNRLTFGLDRSSLLPPPSVSCALASRYLSLFSLLFSRSALASITLFLATAALASAQTDEIQVYDAVIAEPGVFNRTWHNNFTAEGRKMPSFSRRFGE